MTISNPSSCPVGEQYYYHNFINGVPPNFSSVGSPPLIEGGFLKTGSYQEDDFINFISGQYFKVAFTMNLFQNAQASMSGIEVAGLRGDNNFRVGYISKFPSSGGIMFRVYVSAAVVFSEQLGTDTIDLEDELVEIEGTYQGAYTVYRNGVLKYSGNMSSDDIEDLRFVAVDGNPQYWIKDIYAVGDIPVGGQDCLGPPPSKSSIYPSSSGKPSYMRLGRGSKTQEQAESFHELMRRKVR